MASPVSALRVLLMVGGVLALLPLAFLFGLGGVIVGLVFIVLAAVAS